MCIHVHASTRRHPTLDSVGQNKPVLRIVIISVANGVIDGLAKPAAILWMYTRHEILERDLSRGRPSEQRPPRVGCPDLIRCQVPFPNSQVNRLRCEAHTLLTLPQRLVLGHQLCNVHARSDVTGEIPSRVIPRHALVRDPAILAVVTSEPVLHDERLPSIERFRVRLQTSLHVVWMDALSPAISDLLLNVTAGK